MSADFTHNESVIFYLKCKTVGEGDAAFPIISLIIHFFYIHGRALEIRHKQLKLP